MNDFISTLESQEIGDAVWENNTSSLRYSRSEGLIESAKAALKEIKVMPDNWDGYGSPVLAAEIYDSALAVIEEMEYFTIPPFQVVPVSGGGVQFEWSYQGKQLEIEFSEAGKIGYLKVFANREMEEGEVLLTQFNEIYKLLDWLNE